ncbi:MAG: hypothetical protein ABFS45_18280, partial [Pseudomonadota bacterium]
FVKYGQYSPQMNEKSGSASLALATVAILGQPPREKPNRRCIMKQISSKDPATDILALLGNAPTDREIIKTMSHLAKQNKDVVPALYKALPVDLMTNQQVLQQAFSLVDDPKLQADMVLALIKAKLPLTYLIPVMEPALQSINEYTLLFQSYLDQATITSHQSDLMSLPHGRLVGFLVALDQLTAKDSETLYARAWEQLEQWEPQITASSFNIPYSPEAAIVRLQNARMWGDDVIIAYIKHNLSDQLRMNENVITNAVGFLKRPDFFAPQLIAPILDARTAEREQLNVLLLIIKLLNDRTNLLALYLDPQDAITAVNKVKGLSNNKFADILLMLHRVSRSDSTTARDLVRKYLDAPQWVQDSPIVKTALTKKALAVDENVVATINTLTVDSPPDVKAGDDSESTMGTRVQVILKNIPESDLQAKALKILFKSPNDIRASLLLYLDEKTLDYAASRNEMKRDKDYFVGLFLALADIKGLELSRNESLPALERYLVAYPDSYLIAKFLMHRTLESENNPQFSLQIYARLPKSLRILPDLTRLFLAGIEKSSGTVNSDLLELIPELAINMSEKAANVYRPMQEQVATMKREKPFVKPENKEPDQTAPDKK